MSKICDFGTPKRGWYFQLYFKVGLSPSRKVSFICLNESPLKIMKNNFYFTFKALFVRKQTRKQIIAIYILPYISRSKGNEKMKRGQ